MSEDIPLSVIEKTQTMLGPFVKKPALSEKLLRKPPFRFLHDIILAVKNEHGVLDGLFTSRELVSDNVKDKEAKVAFLQKLIDVLGFLEGNPLKVKASRIVAGQEAERTNALLQSLATILAQKTDTKDAVRHVIEGKGAPGPEKGKNNALSDSNKPSTNKSKAVASNSNKNQDPPQKKPETKKLDAKAAKKPSESKTSSKVAPSDKKSNTLEPKATDLKSKSSRSPSRERGKTHKVVKEPIAVANPQPSAEHSPQEASPINQEAEGVESREMDRNGSDLANSVVVEKESNGHEAGMAETAEMSEVSSSSNNTLIRKSARPASRLGRLNSGLGGRATPAINEPETPVERTSARRSSTSRSMQRLEATQEESVKSASPTRPVPLSPTPEPVVRPPSSHPPPRPSASARPRSSRRPPSRAGHFNQVQASLLDETVRPVTGKVANVILEGDIDEEEPELALDSEPVPFLRGTLNDEQPHGLLVDQILQVQRQTESTSEEQTSVSTWPLDGDAWRREMERGRTQVQQLTRLALPLGQTLAYLQEDLEVAQEEARRWAELVKMYQQQLQQIAKTDAVTTPLEAELKSVSAKVEEARSRLHLLQTSVYGNDEKIRQLLIPSR